MNRKTIIALVAFVLLVGIALGIYFLTRPETEEEILAKRETPDGKISVTLVVVHSDKTEKRVTVKTDAVYLEQVLLAEGIVKEADNNNGLYDTFDGEKADWNVDEGWWQIFEGETASVKGVKEIPLTDGGVYKMVYTIGFEGF